MTVFETLILFEGRIGRTPYWKALLAITVVALSIELIGSIHDIAGTILAVIIGIPWFIALLAILVKRLHDLNLKGWWVLILTVPGIAGHLGWDLTKEGFTDAFGYAWRSAIDQRLGQALVIIGVIVLGLISGTRGPNRYGPDPRERQA